MRVHLSSVSPPAGRCMLLARTLMDATGDQRSVEIAERLFDHQFPTGRPVEVEAKCGEEFDRLRDLCQSFGITCEACEA